MLLVNRAEQLAHSAKMSHFTTFAYEARFSSQNEDIWRENSNIRSIMSTRLKRLSVQNPEIRYILRLFETFWTF